MKTLRLSSACDCSFATAQVRSPTICGIPFLRNKDYSNLNNLVNSLFDDVSGERCCKRFLTLLSPIALALLRLTWGNQHLSYGAFFQAS
ncbi:hypothetical protein T10_9050 [Trichinella papuae]|uniref:Uncharacterized protein n=1 Tax=Trichinella papuae TaxID=268474 RepID=A0A0V1M3N6_9BILA|nr:hypothetical protein T10_9050 [Trichinella papuae]